MKKTAMLVTTLLLCLFFVGCQEESPVIDYAEIPLDAVQNIKNATTISLGMSQKEAEALLGRVDKGSNGWYAYKNGLSLQYAGDTLTRIALRDGEVWAGKYGFVPGSPSTEIWRFYGELTPTDETIGAWTAPSLVYAFDSQGLPTESEEESAYTVCFMLTDELDQIETIVLSIAP